MDNRDPGCIRLFHNSSDRFRGESDRPKPTGSLALLRGFELVLDLRLGRGEAAGRECAPRYQAGQCAELVGCSTETRKFRFLMLRRMSLSFANNASEPKLLSFSAVTQTLPMFTNWLLGRALRLRVIAQRCESECRLH